MERIEIERRILSAVDGKPIDRGVQVALPDQQLKLIVQT